MGSCEKVDLVVIEIGQKFKDNLTSSDQNTAYEVTQNKSEKGIKNTFLRML